MIKGGKLTIQLAIFLKNLMIQKIGTKTDETSPNSFDHKFNIFYTLVINTFKL
jgi:hypothetical protein